MYFDVGLDFFDPFQIFEIFKRIHQFVVSLVTNDNCLRLAVLLEDDGLCLAQLYDGWQLFSCLTDWHIGHVEKCTTFLEVLYKTGSDVAGNSRCVRVGNGSGNAYCEPYKEELERQATVGHQLLIECSVAPVPGHVEVGGIHADEQPHGRNGAISSSRCASNPAETKIISGLKRSSAGNQ